jgi:Tfp pilus assembly protein PilV
LTLAEVLLSLGLIVVAILSAIALSIAATRSTTKSSDLMVAQAYAGQVMEEFVYALPPSSDSFWTSGSYSSPYQQDSAQLGDKTYQASLFLNDLSAAQPGLLRCSVNVTWQSGQVGQAGQGRQVTEVSRLLYAH